MIYMVELEGFNTRNLVLNSSRVGRAPWTLSAIQQVDANAGFDSRGRRVASRIVKTTSTAFSSVRADFALEDSTTYTCQAVVEGQLYGAAIVIRNKANTFIGHYFDVFTGISQGDFNITNIETLQIGPAKYRFKFDFDSETGGTQPNLRFLPMLENNSHLEFAGDGVNGPLVSEVQVARADDPQGVIDNGDSRLNTFYFASQHGGFTTATGDSPANQHYMPRLANAGNYERSLFSQGTTRGRSEVGFGDIELDNQDGGLDHLADYAFDGRGCRTYRMQTRKDFTSRELILSGTVEQPELSFSRINLRFRDRLAELSRVPVSPEFFAGTTTGPGATAEGTADLADQRKPVGFGEAFSIPAVLSNPFNLLYTYSYRAASSVSAVRDAAVDYTFISDQPDLASLIAVSLTPGQYATCVAEGVLRIGGQPFGQIAVDVVFSGGTTPADIVDTLLTSLGITGLNQASRAALNADPDASMPCGIWVNGSDNALTVITRVLESVGAYITVNRQGEFVLGLLEPASGLPVTTWDETQLGLGGRLDRLATGDQGAGVPAKSVTIQFKPRYDNADVTGFAGRVTADVAAELARPFETAKADNQRVADERLLAPELVIETQLVSRADAEAQAARRLSFYDTVRERYRIAIPAELGPIELGEVRAIKHPRFGLADGKSFTVTGVEEDFRLNRTVVDLWS